ncbi:Coronin, related [Eimeria mitis]|uniref:Coronin n=1 Tax=Eimeria mitis TaxID=44415 RepID=U6JSE5_9EIME|nr:Coronin, related [Eimeria mitis]CDJ28365.1 Coronin, related [Eimeria mitis]
MGDATERIHIKNCYAEPWKVPYSDIRLASKQTESVGMACSYRYVAAPWDVGGGGMMGLINLADCGRNPPVTKIKGHTGSIQDLAFSPFYESILASGSEDMTIRIWDVPSDPPPGHELKDPVAILTGSAKKVIATEWNPVADFILASGCFDGTVALWDVDSASLVNSISLSDSVLSVKWSNCGDKLATTSKDKALSIIDPRAKNVVASVTCHEGPKATKCCWVDGFAGAAGHVLTTGSSKTNVRELHLWDVKNITKPLVRVEIDRGSQPLYPIFDETLGMLYVAGKGDGNLRYFQLCGGELRRVDEYRSNVPIKSFCFIPKLAVDQKRAEVGRMLKNENGKVLLPVSFIVPRKNMDVFQADLYPPTPGVDAALTAAEWLSGKNGEVKRIVHQPGNTPQFKGAAKSRVTQAGGVRRLESVRSVSEQAPSVLQKTVEKAQDETKRLDAVNKSQETQIHQLQARIKELEPLEAKVKQQEAKIKALESQVQESAKQSSSTSSGELEENMRQLEADNVSLRAQLEDSSSKVVQALKECKAKDAELQKLRSQLDAAEKQLAELSSNMARAEGTLHRAATLSGLDEGVRQEFNEMRDFFREILDGTLVELNKE